MGKNVFDGHGETASSTPVAGHQTGGGVSYGMAEHHQKAGEDVAHTFPAKQPEGHHLAEHHKGHHTVGPADGINGTKKSGQLRMSGVKGAHRIGQR